MTLRAYRASDGTEVRPGDTVTDFRGDRAVFERATRAPDGHRTGKVCTTDGGEVYMSVYSLVVRDDAGGGHGSSAAGCAGTLSTCEHNQPRQETAAMTVAEALAAADAETEFHYSALLGLAETIRAAGAMTVQVTVKDQFGTLTVCPANDTARTFARIAQTKTLTAATTRGIRELGYAIEVLPGEHSELPGEYR
jgi:hypothetical protein